MIVRAARHWLLLMLWLVFTPAVLAQAPAGCVGTATPARQLVIECQPGFATDRDRLEIVTAQGFDPARDWQTQLNTTNAAWIFDAGADETANLIILFEQQESEGQAQIFDDQNNNGRVDYQRDGSSVEILEGGGRPTVVVTAQQGWVHENGAINFNYDITIDGPVDGMIDADKLYLRRLKTDGTIDLTAHVRDSDNDGRPDYEWRQAYPPLAEQDGFYHSSVMVNTADDEPPIADFLFWPLLGSSAQGFIKGDYSSTSAPPVNVDWQRSKINYLVESVASRNRPHNFFVYTIERIKEGAHNDVNFESPFAFYQFSSVPGNFPDVALRVAYYPAGTVSQHLPVEEVDFSWRQAPHNTDSLPTWDYRVGLTGHNAHVGQITLPDFSMRITPYEQLPRWVVDNSWDYASFVARERGNYLSSEGIYEWSTLEGAIVDVNNQEPFEDHIAASRHAAEEYVLGRAEEPPAQYFQQIRKGLRGEFRSRPGEPKLYFSPIDRKLHLLGADHGVWQIDESRALRYANLNQDAYLDQWIYTAVTTGTTTITTTRQLNVAPSHLFYADEAGITIREARTQPSLFEALPPADQSAWESLGARLNASQRSFDPDDLKGLMQQFAGPEQRLTGAQFRDYRPIGKDGFRFVLHVEPGFGAQGAALLNTSDLTPGDYAVTYTGAFTIEPLTPPALSATLQTTALNQLQPSALQLTLRNDGLQDHPASTLELWAESERARATLVATDTVTLLAQEPLNLALSWTPPDAGVWTLTPRLRAADQSAVTLDSARINVAPTQVISAAVLISASASFKTLPVIVGVALLFAALAAYIWRQQWTGGGGR